MNFLFLRIVTVILPLLFIIMVDILRHMILLNTLHTANGFLITYAVITIGMVIFSWVVFGVIARLQIELLEQNRRLAALNQVAAALAEKMELQQLLELALDSVLATMQVEAGVICTLDREHDELVAACHRNFSESLAERVRRAKLDNDPIGGQVVRTGQPVVMERIFEDPRVSEVAAREGIRSALSVPLLAQNEVVGVLAIASHHERRFPPIEVEVLTNLGSQIGTAIRNGVLDQHVRRSNQEMTTLLAVGRAAASSLQLRDMLNGVLDTLLDVTDIAAAEVWVRDGDDVVLEAHRGAFPSAFLERTRFPLGVGFPGIVVQTKEPRITHNLPGDPEFLRQDVVKAGIRTLAAWPLLRQGQALGVLIVASELSEALGRPNELRLMQGIAEHLAAAVENALLHQQVQDAAVVEERERIAHEMHDNLAQVLGYINMQILALRKLVTQNATESAMQQLGEMQDSVQQLYADVREGILGLRSSPDSAGGLLHALEEYLERYRLMVSFPVLLTVAPEAQQLRLRHAAEIQVMRIIQEALSNVRKHARASRVSVSLSATGNNWRLEIADDGVGFDLAGHPPTGWPHFGLQTMRERAEAVGGTLVVTSAPGRGTSAAVILPMPPE